MADKILRVRLLPHGNTELPRQGRIVHAYEETEGEPPTLIVIGDPLQEKRKCHILILAPGWAIPPDHWHIATYETKNDGIRLVFVQEDRS